jgi:hypothetical protein
MDQNGTGAWDVGEHKEALVLAVEQSFPSVRTCGMHIMTESFGQLHGDCTGRLRMESWV